jgi:MarR family transcriptional regulator, organic hydroperoxide resistance regulator
MVINKEQQELINQIIGLDGRLRHCMEDGSPEVWLELNLSIAQLKTLIFINHEEESNFKRVAEALGVTPPNVTGIIERLVEHGLVNRTENPKNRRMLMLSLTETGKSLLRKLKERKIAHLSAVLSSMTLEQLSAVFQGLSILANSTEKSCHRQIESNVREPE